MYGYRQGELGSQTGLAYLFCLTPGQKARSGGRDGQGPDAPELLALGLLASSPSRSPALTFSAGLLAPQQKLPAPTLRLPLPICSLPQDAVLPDWSCLTPVALTSATHVDSGSYRVAVPCSVWHTTSERAEALSPGHRCG